MPNLRPQELLIIFLVLVINVVVLAVIVGGAMAWPADCVQTLRGHRGWMATRLLPWLAAARRVGRQARLKIASAETVVSPGTMPAPRGACLTASYR